MTNQRVLVLMSSYNGEKYIEEQILSIMNQESEYQIDLLIRDDGSTDNTCDIIIELQKVFYARIKLIKGERLGYNASFFTLICQAEGYLYYALSDQDDVWLPNKIQAACEKLRNENNDKPLLYASTSFLVGDDLKPYGTTRKQVRELTMYNTIVQNICPGHTQVMNNALLALLKEDLDYSKIYVYDSWIANIANLYGKIVFDNQSYTYYRQHQANQLGSGSRRIQRIHIGKKRIAKGDGKKYRQQIEYFTHINETMLICMNYFHELSLFIASESFVQRLKYIFQGKLHRQSKTETLAFYIAILCGMF